MGPAAKMLCAQADDVRFDSLTTRVVGYRRATGQVASLTPSPTAPP
jgi:hypothetical protein